MMKKMNQQAGGEQMEYIRLRKMSVNDACGMHWKWDIAALILPRVILMKRKLGRLLKSQELTEKKYF